MCIKSVFESINSIRHNDCKTRCTKHALQTFTIRLLKKFFRSSYIHPFTSNLLHCHLWNIYLWTHGIRWGLDFQAPLRHSAASGVIRVHDYNPSLPINIVCAKYILDHLEMVPWIWRHNAPTKNTGYVSTVNFLAEGLLRYVRLLASQFRLTSVTFVRYTPYAKSWIFRNIFTPYSLCCRWTNDLEFAVGWPPRSDV